LTGCSVASTRASASTSTACSCTAPYIATIGKYRTSDKVASTCTAATKGNFICTNATDTAAAAA
jgi:hypothetical protein